jgi:multiple sugar transport system ATP-binding protein
VVQEGENFLITSPSFRLQLDDICKARFLGYRGNPKLKLGVRPEDVLVSLTPMPNSFGLKVDFVEPQGDRTIISLQMNGDIFLAQVLGDLRPEVNQTVYVTFDQRHMHFFDVETGVNVLYMS